MKLRLYRTTFIAMGCPCETAVYAKSVDAAQPGFAIVEREVLRLDRKYSHYRPDSLLSHLTVHAARPGGCAVDPETAAILDYANHQYLASNGLFDITARSLTRLWDRARSLPGKGAIKSALKRTGWDKAKWGGERLELPPGFELDLGGIVKEYAADRAALLLRRAGYIHGFVDLGGDFHVIGPHPNGTPWEIGIRNPLDRDKAAAVVDVYAGGLASSGDYERFSEIDGTRYSHFINPQTGWALRADPKRSAVSVVAPSCLLGGSVATLAMLLRGKLGKQLLIESGFKWLELGHTNVYQSLGLKNSVIERPRANQHKAAASQN